MKSNVDELLEKINIVDVVSEYVKLRKGGKDYLGLCPFHKEKTPSFTVSNEKQIFYCFGCHQGGNALNFVMKHDHLSFQEALEKLAHRYGIKISRRAGTRKPKLIDALTRLAEYYEKGLQRSGFARDYLKKRGIDNDTAAEFRIGYSDPTRRDLREFLKSTGIPNDIFLSTGIVRMRDRDIYEMFRGRVIIPILDINNQVIGFGGRTLEKDGIPKYINSPESTVFTKRSTLFGIDKTKRHIAEAREVFIVEGYFDFISLYRIGFRNVVATLGTAVTEDHLMKLRNYAERIILMLDGDEAGIKSSLRLIPLISESDIECDIVLFPDGHDPDSFTRKEGVEGITKLVGNKKPLLDFLFDYYRRQHDVGTFEGKKGFVKTVLPFVEGISNPIKQRLYVKKLAELTGVEEHYFQDTMKHFTSTPVSEGEVGANIIENKVVGALLNNPGLVDLFENKGGVRYIVDSSAREILSRLSEYLRETGSLDVKTFINVLESDELRKAVVKADFDVSQYDKGELERVVEDYLYHMEKKGLQGLLREITVKLSDAEKKGDNDRIDELLMEKRRVLSSMKQAH